MEFDRIGLPNYSVGTDFDVLVIKDLVKIAVLNATDLKSFHDCTPLLIKNNLPPFHME